MGQRDKSSVSEFFRHITLSIKTASKSHKFTVGLSGGIGSGKTVASDHFATFGIDIIDTDVIARDIVKPNQPALVKLVSEFGNTILTDNGELNRAELRQIAFSNAQNKAKLDNITHPAIHKASLEKIAQSSSPYCIVVVPLLSKESAFSAMMDRILIVSAELETKISRVEKRSQLSREEVLRIMSTQLSDEQRAEFADDIIENNSSLKHVYTEVERLHQYYLKLSLER